MHWSVEMRNITENAPCEDIYMSINFLEIYQYNFMEN